jgi:hypothetical protein
MISLQVDVASLAQHPEKVSILVARAFFRELRRHNFTDSQVVRVASELIDCLNKSLEGYKDKIAKEKGVEGEEGSSSRQE